MKQLKVPSTQGNAYETYTVLYENGRYILVQNDSTGRYTFGMASHAGTLRGIPSHQSELKATAVQELIHGYLKVSERKDSVFYVSEQMREHWNAVLTCIQENEKRREQFCIPLTFKQFKKSVERNEWSDGYEKFIDYYYFDAQHNTIAWIRKSSRVTRFTKGRQYTAARGCTYIPCRTLAEAEDVAYQL